MNVKGEGRRRRREWRRFVVRMSECILCVSFIMSNRFRFGLGLVCEFRFRLDEFRFRF